MGGVSEFNPWYDYLILDVHVRWVPSADDVEEWIRAALTDVGTTVLECARTVFPSPMPGAHAYTMVLVLSSSHAAVHTAPEHGWVHLVFAMCSNGESLDRIEKSAREFFSPLDMRVARERRGLDLETTGDAT